MKKLLIITIFAFVSYLSFITPSFAITEPFPTPLPDSSVDSGGFTWNKPFLFVNNDTTNKITFCLGRSDKTFIRVSGTYSTYMINKANTVDVDDNSAGALCTHMLNSSGTAWIDFVSNSLTGTIKQTQQLNWSVLTTAPLKYIGAQQIPFGSYYDNLGTLLADTPYYLLSQNYTPSVTIDPEIETGYTWSIKFINEDLEVSWLHSNLPAKLTDYETEPNYYSLLPQSDDFSGKTEHNGTIIDDDSTHQLYDNPSGSICDVILSSNYSLYNLNDELICKATTNPLIDDFKNNVSNTLAPFKIDSDWGSFEFLRVAWNNLVDMTAELWTTLASFFVPNPNTFKDSISIIKQDFGDKIVVDASVYETITDLVTPQSELEDITVDLPQFGTVPLIKFDLIEDNIDILRSILRVTLALTLTAFAINIYTKMFGGFSFWKEEQ